MPSFEALKHDLIVVAGWLVATAIVNALLRVRTVEQWEALAEKNPRYAAAAQLLRAVGLDPVKMLQSLVDLVRGKAASKAGILLEQAEEPKPEEPKPEEPKPEEPKAEEPKAEEPQDEVLVAKKPRKTKAKKAKAK
ncbi:MAG: hypothetical protein EBT03_12760 [Betaproteobacteria bacterium]|nr:hypothetical protein [Betaproteobacteria bacterium]